MIARPFVRLRRLRRVSCSPRSAYGTSARRVTEEDIHALLARPEAGVIEEHERDMVRNVFRLDDRQLGSLMVQGATWSPSTRSCRGRRTRSA